MNIQRFRNSIQRFNVEVLWKMRLIKISLISFQKREGEELEMYFKISFHSKKMKINSSKVLNYFKESNKNLKSN